MKFELEYQDIEAVAERVVELLRPLLPGSKRTEEEVIFNIKGVSEYLNVTPKWIYERTHLKEIPHFKLSNKQLRFRKKRIDEWIKELEVPAASQPTGKLRIVK